MGFLNNTWLGDLISGAVEKADKHVQKGFDSIENKIDEFENGKKTKDEMPLPPVPTSIINPNPVNTTIDLIKAAKYKMDTEEYIEKKTGIKKSNLL